MSDTVFVIFAGSAEHWLCIVDGRVIDRGTGFPSPDEGSRIVGVVPAGDVVIHQIALPDLTDAQARGAARLAVAENSASAIDTLHVAVGADLGGERTVVALDAVQMAEYVAAFTARGLDTDAIIAAPLILPRPEIGFVMADLGNETVIRGRDGAFGDDPVLTPLLTGGQIVTLDAEEVVAAIVAAVAVPEVDLRQGVFARRRRWAVDTARLRRIGWLAAACLATLLILPVAEILHLKAAASRVEAANMAIAQSVLPSGTVVADPLAQLDERLASLGGAGAGFVPLANAVASAARATANVELGRMTFDSDGGLHVSAHATGPAELAAFESRMAGAGLVVVAAPMVAGFGRPARDFTVRAR
ncbi:N/A [soil metagenome]